MKNLTTARPKEGEVGAAIVDSVGIEKPPCLASLERGRGHGEDVGVQTLLPGPPRIGKGHGHGRGRGR